MIARFFTLAFCASLLFSCKNDKPTDVHTTEVDSTQQGPAPEPPPITQAVKDIVDEQLAKSPFKGIECCTDETRRKEPCCCDGVLEKYRQMRAAPGTTDFAKLKTSDPILSTCRKSKKHRKEFELIDNPPPPPGKKAAKDDDMI